MTTFVLVHGAYQGGWIWLPTAARLRAAGHLVYAPSLDGCAERRHSLRPNITTATHASEIAELTRNHLTQPRENADPLVKPVSRLSAARYLRFVRARISHSPALRSRTIVVAPEAQRNGSRMFAVSD